MRFEASNESPIQAKTPCLIIGVFSDGELQGTAAEVDRASGGQLNQRIEDGHFPARGGAVSLWPDAPGVEAGCVIVVGAGKREGFSPTRLNGLAVKATRLARDRGLSAAFNCLPELGLEGRDADWVIRQTALGCAWADYRYSATRKLRPHEQTHVELMTFPGDSEQLATALHQAAGMAAGVARARELGNLPPNICNPEYLATQAEEIAALSDKASCEILDRKAMENEGMEALLGVARGSRNEPRLIVLRYDGAGNDESPVALVGKGITFDTGGISLKPGKGMDEMKYDMCGAAGVLGAFEACVRLALPINLLTVVPAVENMPDGDAYRPGDVVTSLSGQTIEVLNTDAEGRMILCDALTYTQRYKPQSIIDVATLTGACVIALGKEATGLMSQQDDLADELLAAGVNSHDRAWRLPIWDEYQKLLDTPYADMQNVGGPTAGAITAGCFLARFNKKQRWAHLDVAGTAWDGGTKNGATGRPVPLLTQYLIDRAG